ncbi:MAG: GntR family transcriptional regulator [Kiritimatiellia bacterium]|jgi:GntR family transcriptional regulator
MGVAIHQDVEKLLHIQLDLQSGIPIYRQVIDQLKYYISSGSLQTGDKLPSIRALSQYLSVNPTTIVKAYSELQHEGVIEMRQGKGAFIAERTPKVTRTEQKKIITRLARQLAVEARQIGCDAHLVREILEEELKQAQLNEEGNA